MSIPIGYTLPPEERKAFLVESIRGLEEALATAADRISYPNAGDLEPISRAEAIARLRLFYSQLARVTDDKALAAEVNTGPRFLRVVGQKGYRGGIYGGRYGYPV